MSFASARARVESERELWAPSASATRWIVALLAVVAVAVRLTYIPRKPGTDEAGYLLIAQQWHGSGTSLYTDQWIDRPPLLLVLFQIGDLMGGLTGVRVLGALVAAVVVVGTAVAAGLLAGRRAALVAAAAMAAWSFSPAFASITVNGEYLAAPFIVWSIAGTVAALQAIGQRRALLLGALAGAAGFAAILVKQNHAEGLLFGLLACLFARTLFGTDRARALQVFGAAAGGGVVAVGLTAALCAWRGTSVSGVYEAMYPFRFKADDVKSAGGLPPFAERFDTFGHIWIASGVLLVTVVAIVVGMLNRRHRGAVVVLVVVLAFVHASVASGQNFYGHYMVQVLVPVAILAGVAATRSRWVVPGAVALVVAAAVVVTPGSMFQLSPGDMSRVGGAMHEVGQDGDSIVVIYGRPGVVLQAGMKPAYENLFTLPLRVRDPELVELNRVLSSDDPPTWVVTWGPLARWNVPTDELKATLNDRYSKAGEVCGKSVLLLDGVERHAPEDVCAP
ncbi:MAG: hypothetical protein JWP31_1397 [Aeromicrobium sp.]|nr:hypothetical protein [Aeromicrobium sp.]